MNTNAPGAPAKSGVHPGLIVGAIAVVVFGAAGAASYLGLLPGQATPATASPVGMASPAQQAGMVPDAVVQPKPAPAPEAAPAPVAAAPAPAPVQEAPAQAAPAPRPEPAPVQATPPAPKAAPAPRPAPVAARPVPTTPSYATSAPAYEPSAPPPVAAAPAPPPAPVRTVCGNCGTVTDVIPIEKKGESSGAGAVLGGIVGGVLGHQVGGGRGKDVATVAGALGGAFVGNEVEKNKGSTTAWDVRVKLEDGSNAVVRQTTQPSWRVGDKVRVENGKLVRG
jgi:outer membrane lipoprotein SlyB